MSSSPGTAPSSILFWNRAERREERELVYGDRAVRLLYDTRAGQKLADRFLSGRLPSACYGWYQDSPLSRSKIAPFIERYQIPMVEYEAGPFSTFNEFFTRRFKPGARIFAQESGSMPAFCEARYLAFEQITESQIFPVKGEQLTATALLGAASHAPDVRERAQRLAEDFRGGPLLLARLCPVDYHRFHFPDDGNILEHFTVRGVLHSVNPLALRYRSEIFATNERQISILRTKSFGKLAYIEVGALCVGKIIQTHPVDAVFQRGQEKGMFRFGASTVIVIGQKEAWRPDPDLLEQTARRRETLVRLGDRLAGAVK